MKDSSEVSKFLKNVKSTTSSLPERVAEQINELIVERHLTSNDKLPNEFELANLLNVGRGTIREAVKLLIARNVLVIRRGKGTFIAQHPGEIEDPLGFSYYSNQLKVAVDLLEVRMHVEPWVARLATERATPENLKEMNNLCDIVENEIISGKNHLPKDIQFHISIAKCTNNLVITKLIPIITYSVSLFASFNDNSLLKETISCHRAIANAITNKNADEAEKAMIKHLEQNKTELENIIKTLK